MTTNKLVVHKDKQQMCAIQRGTNVTMGENQCQHSGLGYRVGGGGEVSMGKDNSILDNPGLYPISILFP